MNDTAKLPPTTPLDLDYDRLEFHPLSNLLPMMNDDARHDLAQSIKDNGLRNPLCLCLDPKDGKLKILDGRHRHLAGKDAGYIFTAKDFTILPAGVDPRSYVYAQNLHRRQLTMEDKKAIGLQEIENNPSASDRSIARLVGVDHKTVAGWRKEMDKAVETFTRTFDGLTPLQRRQFFNLRKDQLRSLA
jgi:ParB/Sulfiredoxin domain